MATTSRPANSVRPTTGGSPTGSTTSRFNAFEPTGGSSGSPSWQQAYDMSKDWLNNSVSQGRQVAQEAASTRSHYEGLQQSRDFTYQQANQANQQAAQNNPHSQMQQSFDKKMETNSSGGRLAFGGQGNGYTPGSNSLVPPEVARHNREMQAYQQKAATDNYYSTQSRNADKMIDVQQANNSRAFQADQSREERAYQQQQSALDRQQQAKLAMLDSQTKLQSSMLQSLNMGGGGGFNFW